MVFESGETDTVNGREVQIERREDLKDCTYSCGPREKKRGATPYMQSVCHKGGKKFEEDSSGGCRLSIYTQFPKLYSSDPFKIAWRGSCKALKLVSGMYLF